jgi:hypothetical protein
MMKFTVDWNDKMLRWDVVRWDTTAEGVYTMYTGTTVDRCAVLEKMPKKFVHTTQT